ncbi:helix-turn-helix domain-containing protein [Lysinibacillus sp. NPDC093688]|uniref:helix-turn-helix domain-containing protein n=1 Tax=Lysinibacillus sp. NPDC093688 TaxID=3390577 RepID=UPI003D094BAC
MDIKHLIDYYAHASVKFTDVFTNKMEPGQVDKGRTTAPGKCGLVVPLAGSAIFSFNGTPYTMEPGMIVHAGPQMPIEIRASDDKGWEYAVVHYQLSPEESILYPLSTQHFLINTGYHTKIIDYVQQLIESKAMLGNMSVFKAKTLFMNLLEAILMSAKVKVLDTASDEMEQALQYIHENYATQLSVSKIAEEFSVERRRFAYLFEQHTGMNPSVYLTEYRIRRSKELLKYDDSPVAEIAECVGYVDCFYFSRVFKKCTGMSPTTYRKTMLEEAKYL